VLDQLTIVIITFKRYPFLKRLMKFYEGYNLHAQILVLDSTPEYPENNELKELLSRDNVTWKKYDSSIFLANKISEGCKHIKTEYVALCADDDFLIPTALIDCVHFLAKKPDYESVTGLDFQHLKDGGIRNNLFRISPLTKGRSSEENTASERVHSYLSGKTGYYPMYAVHRSLTFKTIWNETTKYVCDWGLSEIFPCSLSFAQGKMKVLPVFYVSREPNSFSPFNEKRTLEMYSEEKLNSVVNGLSKYIKKIDGYSQNEAERLSRNAFDIFLERSRLKRQKSKQLNDVFYMHLLKKIKSKLRIRTRVIYMIHQMFYQGCHPSIYPKYFKDFERVKEAVLSVGLTDDELNESRKFYV
jgi:glycosyltransferase domain-containing protein